MGLADGDLYVSGSILSFQQMKRIYQNFRAATVPSNLQAGALWSKSIDDTLWHQGTTLDEVFTEQTTLTWENLLSNSGFGVWSQSDASKGLATITYDQGAKGAGAAPSVGDAVVGANGGTAKLISYTTATGTWDAGNATGVLTVGAVSHDFAFVDNEVLTFGGVETAAVNMADSAVQVGLVQNGGYAAATTGWTAANGAILASIAGGKVGNCLRITCNGSNNPYAYQEFTTEVGKIYKAVVFIKAGTEATYNIKIGQTAGASDYYLLEDEETAGDWSTTVSFTLEALTTSTFLSLRQTAGAGAGTTLLFDEVTFYEITPCCTAGDTKAFDAWYKSSDLDIYREHSGSNTKPGSFYALKVVPAAQNKYLMWRDGERSTNADFYKSFDSQTICSGVWVKTSTASHVELYYYKDAWIATGIEHTGGGGWEWLEFPNDCGTITTELSPLVLKFKATPAVNGDTIAYVSQPMLVFGSHIGEGNYQPKPHDVIACTVLIDSNKFHGINMAGASETWTTLNVEADTDARLPKGIKAVYLMTGLHDSGSAASNPRFYGRRNSTGNMQYTNNIEGWKDNAVNRITGRQECDVNGDFDSYWAASGAGTLTFNYFRYTAIQLN